jgi:hypothetical protein
LDQKATRAIGGLGDIAAIKALPERPAPPVPKEIPAQLARRAIKETKVIPAQQAPPGLLALLDQGIWFVGLSAFGDKAKYMLGVPLIL